MGWASGSSLLIEVWSLVRQCLEEPDDRVSYLKQLMVLFADHDCDTLEEVVCDEWPESEKAYREFREGR